MRVRARTRVCLWGLVSLIIQVKTYFIPGTSLFKNHARAFARVEGPFQEIRCKAPTVRPRPNTYKSRPQQLDSNLKYKSKTQQKHFNPAQIRCKAPRARPKPNIQVKTPTARLKPEIHFKTPTETLQPSAKSI